LGGVAFETALEFEHRLRAVPSLSAAALVEATIDQHKPAANSDIEEWELHSELVLVCPDVSERARELLPERDPEAFLAKLRQPLFVPSASTQEEEITPSLPTAVSVYTLYRLVQTARSGLLFACVAVALASLADVLR
jgi:hypothetical protein